MKENIIIRLERENEYHEVENLVRESFWNVYRPGCLEHYVLHQLRNDPAFVPELDFVMTLDGQLIGQNMFMKAVIAADDGRSIPIMTMGSICIAPELKRKGYGKILLDYSLEKAKELGWGALCFEGNIDFYGKSGFRQASEFGIRYHGLEEGDDASFFLCKELISGYLDDIIGEYAAPAGYLVNEKEAEAFDREFPYMEKEKLPGQIFEWWKGLAERAAKNSRLAEDFPVPAFCRWYCRVFHDKAGRQCRGRQLRKNVADPIMSPVQLRRSFMVFSCWGINADTVNAGTL